MSKIDKDQFTDDVIEMLESAMDLKQCKRCHRMRRINKDTNICWTCRQEMLRGD